MRTPCLLLPLLIGFAIEAPAQVVFQGSSIQTSVSATTPICTDNGGAPGVPSATASCDGPQGYGAASAATASFTPTSDGGVFAFSAQAAASTPGETPVQQSNANATGNGLANWFLGSSTLYTLVAEGDVGFDFSGTGGSGLPVSGTVPAGSYALSGSASANVVASDAGPLTAAESASGEVEITLVPVGATDLIQGTVLAGGLPQAGLLIEAFDGSTLVASTRTASDGRYLLGGLTTSVVLESSDPERRFLTDVSPLLTPPTTYDADLAPKAVPLLPPWAWIALVALLLFGARRAVAASALEPVQSASRLGSIRTFSPVPMRP